MILIGRWAPLKIIIMKNRTHPSANAQGFMTFFMIFADKNIIFRDAQMSNNIAIKKYVRT